MLEHSVNLCAFNYEALPSNFFQSYFGRWAGKADRYYEEVWNTLCKDYRFWGWQIYKIPNGFYLYLIGVSDCYYRVKVPLNSFEAYLTKDPISIICSLLTFSYIADIASPFSQSKSQKFSRLYNTLLDYAAKDYEGARILKILKLIKK